MKFFFKSCICSVQLGDQVLTFTVSISSLHEVISRPADGGITALHMAALNGHADTVHLLLDIGASASNMTVEDGTTIDLIGMP